MHHLLPRLLRWPKGRTIFVNFLLALEVGALDYATGYEFEVTAFYLVPICWTCWAAGRKAGVGIATVCVVAALISDMAANRSYAHPAVAFWNAAMLLAVFCVAVYSITAALSAFQSLSETQTLLRNANEHLEEIVQQRTAALRSEIAERQRLEEAKMQAERLLERQEKLAVLGTLTAGIAHEIRNPLTSLKARLYTLEKHLYDVPAARKDTDIINGEISRLERIVQDALSFARPAVPKLEPVAPETLLREIEALMATTLESRGVEFIVQASPGLMIQADSGLLKQVVINLVRNGADAIEGLGKLTLRSRSARERLGERETNVVVIEVSDTGKGIPPEIEKRLFDPYFSTKATGTGLGLSIAARIVEQHRGVIRHRTRLNEGTVFEVVLPKAEAQAV